MVKNGRIKHVYVELKEHMPFTMVGALLGMAFMLFFRNISQSQSHVLFAIFHPAHVVLSAMVTASLFKLHSRKTHFLIVLLIGYIGSVGIATVSDSVIPYMGERLLHIDVPSHEGSFHPHENQIHIHLGFIEEWYLVNPAAILGILIAWFFPHTKSPHAAHVLISTWASAAHILMNAQSEITPLLAAGMFLVLFVSVWIPCCFSDIVFPTLFVGSDAAEIHGR
jgi:hypothetical protein